MVRAYRRTPARRGFRGSQCQVGGFRGEIVCNRATNPTDDWITPWGTSREPRRAIAPGLRLLPGRPDQHFVDGHVPRTRHDVADRIGDLLGLEELMDSGH
jgi:hypothetical protein